jgi:phosphotriesterase-related protein
MTVMTVLGPVRANQLGLTLVHEHLFLDLRNQFSEFSDPERQRISHGPLSLANAGLLRRNPYAIRDNLLLDDLALAIQEVRAFELLGGQTIVDCTSVGLARNPSKLRALAQRIRVNIIAGCGYYTQDTHPPEVRELPVEALAEQMLRDLRVGMDGSDVRAGIIGELGTSAPIHPDELKVLRAAALAWRQAPVAIQVHTYPWGEYGLEAARILLTEGVAPARIVICHSDVVLARPYIRALLALGVWVEFDNLGKEFANDEAEGGFAGGAFASDAERVRVLVELIDAGYERQLLITNDICIKCMLHTYGGWGYDHVQSHILPMLQRAGVPRATTDALLIDNPRRLLDS